MVFRNEIQLPEYVPPADAPPGQAATHGHNKIFPEDDGFQIWYHLHVGGAAEHRHYDGPDIQSLDEVLLPADTKPWVGHSEDCEGCLASEDYSDFEEAHRKRDMEI